MNEQKKSKNKPKRQVNWPKSQYFTLHQLFELNATTKEITLRVDCTNLIKDGKCVEIGSLPASEGRPRKVFAYTPISRNILQKAEAEGIRIENREKLINAINVGTPTVTTTTPTPASVV